MRQGTQPSDTSLSVSLFLSPSNPIQPRKKRLTCHYTGCLIGILIAWFILIPA